MSDKDNLICNIDCATGKALHDSVRRETYDWIYEKGCKDTKDKIINFINLNKFTPMETINFINDRHSRGFWINTEDIIKELSGEKP